MNADIIFSAASASLGGALALAGAVRARRSISRWMFALGMGVLAAERGFSTVAATVTSTEDFVAWQIWRFVALAFLPGLWLVFSLTYARGNALGFLHRWRWRLAVLTLLPPVFLWAAARGDAWSIEFRSLGGAEYLIRFGPWGTAFQLILLITIILVLVNLERTYRASVGTVRWRIKFMLLGLGVVFVARAYTLSQALLFHSITGSLQILNSGGLLVGCLLILRTLFRAGHFELEVYPSRSALQGSVTVLLAGVYLLVVGVLAKIVSYLGGGSSFTVKSLVVFFLVVGLAILLQSDQVQLLLRRLVSRHFQRPMYDYRTVWRKFTAGTASLVEQAEFCRAVVKLEAEIFQALSVALWLVDERREELTLAASTSVSDDRARELQPNGTATMAIIAYLRTHPEPVDIERIQSDWAAALRQCHPAEFHKSGTCVCVPVLSGGQVLGVIMLSDRVGGAAFTLQDFDLLKSISDHIASGLLNVRLSQRLLQTREHEAFQTMAAFFVHDLKNAASTLNLMLQNLPEHFDDPAFREDALRGVGKSVNHINHLISRLSQLRSELKIVPVDSDLNKVVAETLAAFVPPKDFAVETQAAPLPRLFLDREQFAKVVTNLVLNARDACPVPGRLRLSTSRSGAWVVLEAADNGRGIPPEFLANSLFRPFQTTKSNGLGIGMFQSKMIIEAHGGRITVESTVGVGTTFRVFLPIGAA